MKRAERLRSIVGGSAGNLVEWYDWYVYSASSINAVVKAELFPAEIRALGVALPYAVANTVFGGTAEYVALWFKSRGIERGFFIYVTALIATSLVVYAAMPDTRRHGKLTDDEPSGRPKDA